MSARGAVEGGGFHDRTALLGHQLSLIEAF